MLYLAQNYSAQLSNAVTPPPIHTSPQIGLGFIQIAGPQKEFQCPFRSPLKVLPPDLRTASVRSAEDIMSDDMNTMYKAAGVGVKGKTNRS